MRDISSQYARIRQIPKAAIIFALIVMILWLLFGCAGTQVQRRVYNMQVQVVETSGDEIQAESDRWYRARGMMNPPRVRAFARWNTDRSKCLIFMQPDATADTVDHEFRGHCMGKIADYK